MWLQYGRNPHSRSYSGERTSQNGAGEDQGSKRIEDTNEGQEYREFPGICKLLSTFYSGLQPYSKTIKWIERQEGMEIKWRIQKGIWET